MDIPQVQITHQDAAIEIVSQRAKIEITSKRPSFRLIRIPARFHMNTRLPQMRVDRSQAWLLLHKAPLQLFNKQSFLDAREEVLENIAGIVERGNAAMQIEDGITLADIAAMALDKLRELNITAMPKPDVYWDDGYFSVEWDPGGIRLEWEVNATVDIRVQPHLVEVRLRRRPDIKITLKYKNIGRKASGKIVDKYL